ncbi:MAG: T9SS type A sorting domain-containing protein, partial [Mucilaginibacter sp.]
MKLSKYLLSVVFTVFIVNCVYSATYYNYASGSWSTLNTWSLNPTGPQVLPAQLPGSADDVDIDPLKGVVTVPPGYNTSIANLQVQNFSTGTYTSTNYPVLSFLGTSTLTVGSLNFTFTFSSAGISPSFLISGSQATVNCGSLTVLNIASVSSSFTAQLNVNTLNCTGTTTIKGSGSNGFAGDVTLEQVGGTFNLLGGPIKLDSTTSIAPHFVVDNGATIVVQYSPFLSVGSGTGITAIFNPGSTVNYSTTPSISMLVFGLNSLYLVGGVSYSNVIFSGTGPIYMNPGDILSISGDFTNTLTNSGSNQTHLSGSTANFNGSAQKLNLGAGVNFNNISFSGSQVKTVSGLCNVAGSFTNNLTNDALNYIDFTSYGSNVKFNGSSQTLDFGTGNGTTLNNAVFSATGIKTIKNVLHVNGNFIDSLTNDASNFINLTTNATTVTFGGAAQTLDFGAGNGTNLYNVVFSGTGIKTIRNLMGVKNNFTNSLANDASNYIDLTTNATTLTFGGAAQTLDFGTGNGTTLNNAVFSGTGIKTVKNTLAVNGNLTNSLTNNASNYIDLTTNATTVTFSGSSAQALASGTGNPVKFYNVSFGGAGAKTLSGTAGFSVSGKGVLTMQSGSGALAAGGLLTLLSDTTGTASVAAIPTGTSITGNVNVQRYITGSTSGINYRGYRLLSSPVWAATIGSTKVYSINYTKSGAFLTGIGGTANGFDQAGNPTLFFFREDQTPSSSSFTGGNWWGISKINNTPSYNYYFNGGSNVSNIPVGNGYLLFFRGSRSTSNPYTPTTYAQAATLSTAGTLNQGNLNVYYWSLISVPLLSYTTAAANSTVRGLNLVGNPYACTIDWNTSTSGGISLTNISNTISTLNVNGTYGTYQWDGTTGTAINNGSRYIASGQGFFVKATGGGSAALTFTEAAKVTGTGYNPVNTGSTAGTILSAVKLPDSHLRLNLVMDTLNSEETYIGFKAGSSPAMVENEDALYLSGPSKVHFSTQSSDGVNLSINRQPLPGARGAAIHCNVQVPGSGSYTINLTDLAGIPKLYRIILRDAYLKDSADLRVHASYPFMVNTSDTGSYGSNRFTLAISQDRSLMVSLVSFKAQATGQTVGLSWTARNEENYTVFEVERSTDNGKIFKVIDSLSSTGAGSYTAKDAGPVPGLNEYRLKMTDLNGTVSYSVVSTVQESGNTGTSSPVYLYPNPTGGVLNVAIQFTPLQRNPATTHYRYRIFNETGSAVMNGTSDSGNWTINTYGLKPGSYLIQVIDQDNNLTGNNKFMKN